MQCKNVETADTCWLAEGSDKMVRICYGEGLACEGAHWLGMPSCRVMKIDRQFCTLYKHHACGW